jgi:hypothetical protein
MLTPPGNPTFSVNVADIGVPDPLEYVADIAPPDDIPVGAVRGATGKT